VIGVAPSLSIIRAKRSIIVLKPDQQASEAEILAHACERIASYKLRNRLILRCTAAHPRQDSQSNSVDGGWVMSRQMRCAARQEGLLAPGLPEVGGAERASWRAPARGPAGSVDRGVLALLIALAQLTLSGRAPITNGGLPPNWAVSRSRWQGRLRGMRTRSRGQA